MSNGRLDNIIEPAADKNESLVLTPLQDLKGYLFYHVGRLILFLITCTSVLAVLLIFIFVIREALPFVKGASIVQFLTGTIWHPQSEPGEFGALSLVVGSLYVTVVALVIAVPVGVVSAVFLSDIVSFRIRNIVKPVIELLAAIPSVAYGFFAIKVLSPWLMSTFGFPTGVNALNAGLVLSVMALPTIISVSEDSLSAIGRELREASYGLGATRYETLFKVIIPAAHSGIIAAVILGMMRAIGETMVVWMASGNATQIPSPWWDLSQSVGTITATIAGDMAETPKGSTHFHSLFMLGVLLLVFTFCLNMTSEFFLARAKKKIGKMA